MKTNIYLHMRRHCRRLRCLRCLRCLRRLLLDWAFAADYAAMLHVLKTLGTTRSGPDIYVSEALKGPYNKNI